MSKTYAEDVRRKIKNAEGHFSKHVALWASVGKGIEVLDFRRPDSVEYALRIVFDDERGGRVYISGDIGEAVVYPTCRAKLKDMALCFTRRDENGVLDVNEEYFLEKVKATSESWVWGREEFVADFKDRISPFLEMGACGDFDLDEFLEERLGYAHGGFMFYGEDGMHIDEERGVTIDRGVEEELKKVDRDYREWLYDCGKRINPRVIMWLVGMRLAWEQVKEMKGRRSD